MLRGGGAESRRERPSAGTGFPSLTHFTVAVLRLLDFEPVIHRVLSRKIGAWSQGVSFLGELVSASVRHSWPQPTGAALNSLLALLLASQVGESFQPCLEKEACGFREDPPPASTPAPPTNLSKQGDHMCPPPRRAFCQVLLFRGTLSGFWAFSLHLD